MNHYQYRQPFDLPAQATLGGRTFRGTRARVYWLLRITAERNYQHPIGRHLGPPGWVPRFLLVEPWSGGCQGDRRMRELRGYGLDLEMEAFTLPEGGESSTTLWRLRRGTCRHPDPTQPTTTAPLHHLRFQLLTEERGGTAGAPRDNAPQASPRPRGQVSKGSIHLSPGAPHALAPSARIGALLEHGRLSPEGADAAYREELLEAHATGDLVRALAGHTRLEIRCEATGGWSPGRMLERALTALGARLEAVEGGG